MADLTDLVFYEVAESIEVGKRGSVQVSGAQQASSANEHGVQENVDFVNHPMARAPSLKNSDQRGPC